MERILDFGNSFLTSQARGLHNFIAEIRNCNTKEEERVRVDQELANIRQKFSATANLNSYNKKKYVSKMCYIYMLGYDVDFGHLEFISLLSSSKFQEKAVGYLAFALMLRPGDELMTLVVNSMRNDIVSPFHYAQSLALAAAANLGGTDLAELLSSDVQRIITNYVDNSTGAPGSQVEERIAVVKKALLCLLKLYRSNSETVSLEVWTRCIGRLLGDRDLGVLTSAMSLLLGFASANPSAFEPLVPFVISILTRLVVARTCTPDYLYYRTPSPWLQVKCFKFLQYFQIPTDHVQMELLHDVFTKILNKIELNDSNNKSNADHSILFEAINLLMSYGSDTPPSLKDAVCATLGRFIGGSDPNIRYLGLDALTRLAKLDGAESVQMHQVVY
jgi:AP-2 complex subunit alpha